MQSENNIAFKEWAVVCTALGAGRQTIIIRKGGIDEGDEGFRVKHREFWLLPTRFHQDTSMLTPDAEPLWRETQQHLPPAGTFYVRLYAVVEHVIQLHELAKLERLAGRHILSQQAIEQRFYYRQPGVFVLVVRVYRTPQTFEIDESPYIAGCKSWVELPRMLSTEGCVPVLDDAAFLREAGEITSLAQ